MIRPRKISSLLQMVQPKSTRSKASGLYPPPYGLSFLDTVQRKGSAVIKAGPAFHASGSGSRIDNASVPVVQRTLRVNAEEFDGIESGVRKALEKSEGLRQALELYTAAEESKILNKLADWAGDSMNIRMTVMHTRDGQKLLRMLSKKKSCLLPRLPARTAIFYPILNYRTCMKGTRI